MSDLTVLIINKNSGKYIKQTCLSVLSQNFENYRVWILDSGSIDNSLEKIKSIKLIKSKFLILTKMLTPPKHFCLELKTLKPNM